VFQAKLGDKAKTIGHKIQRIVGIVENLGGSSIAKTAAKYCKSDLASHAVGEFPEVQGVMGKHYALLHNYEQPIADAIEQHWWPKGQSGGLPQSDEAALIALADKMDTIVGCFAVGLEPSGSADPFGLRRAAIGIWQILLDRGWRDRFADARDEAIKALQEQGVNVKDVKALDEFFRGRLRGIFVDLQGVSPQDADAALAKGFEDPVAALRRAHACGVLTKDAREVFKRVANIIDDARAKGIAVNATVDPKLFVESNGVEAKLYAEVKNANARELAALGVGDYEFVISSLEQLRPYVSAFFDKGGVLVMDPNPDLRNNRLGLLQLLIGPSSQIADLRKLETS
jgi:glycyl-tRNA synthetase beta chain